MTKQPAEQIQSYLSEWERRFLQMAQLAPEVQQLREQYAWQVEASRELDAYAPREVTDPISSSLARDFEQLQYRYPLPPSRPVVLTGTLTSTNVASTQMMSATALGQIATSSGDQRVVTVVKRYHELQERSGRASEAKTRLTSVFPSLAPDFGEAEKIYRYVKLGGYNVPLGATKMRTLVDKLKGELWERARRHTNENMTWLLMAERFAPDPTSNSRRVLMNQETERSNLYRDLSDLIKERSRHGLADLDLAWSGFIDHIYVVCGCLLEPGSQ